MSNIIDLPSCLLAKVPDGAFDFHMWDEDEECDARLWFSYKKCDCCGRQSESSIPLPPGNYGTPVLLDDVPEWILSDIADELGPNADMSEGVWVYVPKIKPQ